MKVNYDKIARTYDRGRSYSQSKTIFWLEVLKKYGKLLPNSMVVDIGCGTGRYTIPLAEQYSCSVVGIDNSVKMLIEGKIKNKSGKVHWVHADAENLPLSEDIFNFCLMSMVIHHVCERQKALDEAYRVLAANGRCLIRTCSHEQLKNLPDYYFFPKSLKIDVARIPDVPVLEMMLLKAGFTQVKTDEINSPALGSPEEYLMKVQNKYSSTFYLLSEQDYQNGLRTAQEYFSNKPLPEAWKTEPISVIVATKKS